MKVKIKRIISLFLLSLFISAITPDVFIHAFTHHEDTVDFHATTSSFSHQHIHCDRLLDELPAKQLADVVHLPFVPVSFLKLENIFPLSFSLLFSETVTLRGPPSLV
ncbi:MAG: hypothetical protein WCI97_04700 [Bacteroidota bacterium]